MIDVCLNVMKFIYFDHWKKMPVSESADSESQVSKLSGDRFNSSGLMKFSGEAAYYDELAPYFVRDPLNKDSFVIPAPNLVLNPDAFAALPATTQQPTKHLPTINLFDNYTELLTEILIRLPYQMKKLCLGGGTSSGSTTNTLAATESQYQANLCQISAMFEFSSWTHYLCEYLLLSQCFYLKRLIKKLLQILCGSKEKYRKFKDQHILTTCLVSMVNLCQLTSSPSPISMLGMGGTINQATESLSVVNEAKNLLPTQPTGHSCLLAHKLTYLNLLKLVDHLKVILEVAVSRSLNWQRFCAQNPSTLLYLIELALLMGVDSNGSGTDSSSLSGGSSIAAASTSAIIPTILQILLCTLGGTKQKTQATTAGSKPSSSNNLTSQINVLNNNATTATTTTTTNVANQKSSKKTSFFSSSTTASVATTPGKSFSVISDEHLCANLVGLFFKSVSKDIMYTFIRTYLLEAANPNIRWTLHTLLYSVYKNSTLSNQEQLYEILMQLWPDAMTTYGKSRFYLTILLIESDKI